VEEEVVGGPAPERATTPRTRTEDAFQDGRRSVQEEIIVTGSRIRRKDLTGPAPVVVYSREQVQATGRVNVGEFLQTIPEQSNALGRSTNNMGTGSIRVNLRGIGSQATLVLLNGRRVAAGGTGADDSVDLSAIPSNVIERIEILKDGASAIYGSDAIGGVINIITRKRVEGGDVSVLGGTSSRNDGGTVDVSGMLGATSEKGSFAVSMGYYNANPVFAGAREFSEEDKFLDKDGLVKSLGSQTTPNGTITLPAGGAVAATGNVAWNNLVNSHADRKQFTRDASGMWRPFLGDGLAQDGFNYQPYNYLVTPQKRFNVFVTGEYRLGSHARAYVDSFYTKRNSAQTLAPEPLGLKGEGVILSEASVYNPFGRDFDAVNRRLLEFGNRSFVQDVHNFHLATGIDGTTPDSFGFLRGWFWDIGFTFSQNESTELKTGNLHLPRLQAAVGPSFRDPSGIARCGTADNTIEGCVPLNLLGGAGSITPDQVAGLTFSGVQRGNNQLIGTQVNTSGDLFSLFAERPVGLALGYEFRSLQGGQIPDPITVAGETSGNKGLITQGSYSVHEVYGELSIPIIDRRPLAHMVELIAASRGSFYERFGSSFNYKFGGRWSPVPDLSLRGTYSTAFRTPSIPELFGGENDAFPPVSDPCAVVEPGSPRAMACGDAANNGDPANQLRSREGGNDTLRPETAQIFTVGAVIEPRWVKGLYFTADYYRTSITNSLGPIGANVILRGCYPDAAGVMPQFCDLITRFPDDKRVDTIMDKTTNVGVDRLDGLDLAAGWDFGTPVGNWNIQSVASYLRAYDRTLGNTIIEGAGTFDLHDGGSGGAFPHWRFNANLGWALGGFAAGLRTYFIGSYKECGDGEGVMSGDGLCFIPTHVGERMVEASNTWDLTVAYSFKALGGQTGISAGVINLFDQEPPRVYNGFANATDTFSYDLMMRQFFARLTHRF
jgi:iron complex outermembrane recepter protein